MVYFSHIPQESMKKTANVLLFCDCETLTQQIGSAFQESDLIVDYHCLESFVDLDRCIKADIAILDMGFHVQQGLTLLKDIKYKLPEVPVIVLAEEGSEDQVIAAFRLGARDYFKKPLNIMQLIEMVQGLISAKNISHDRRKPVNSIMSQVSTCAVVRTNMPQAIHKSILYMNNCLSENISIEALARAAGMSKHHFCRIFKKYTGRTAMQMLSSLRIERAKWLLKSTDFAISTVAVEAGFSDIGSFIRNFKRFTGITASDYRNSLKLRD